MIISLGLDLDYFIIRSMICSLFFVSYHIIVLCSRKDYYFLSSRSLWCTTISIISFLDEYAVPNPPHYHWMLNNFYKRVEFITIDSVRINVVVVTSLFFFQNPMKKHETNKHCLLKSTMSSAQYSHSPNQSTTDNPALPTLAANILEGGMGASTGHAATTGVSTSPPNGKDKPLTILANKHCNILKEIGTVDTNDRMDLLKGT